MVDTPTQQQKPAQKGTTITLRAPSGERLKVRAELDKKTGGARTFAVLYTAKNGTGPRTTTRGATTGHATLTEALAALQAKVADAVKLGWQRPTGPTLGPKPDAFDRIPAPKPTPAPAAVPAKPGKK